MSFYFILCNIEIFYLPLGCDGTPVLWLALLSLCILVRLGICWLPVLVKSQNTFTGDSKLAAGVNGCLAPCVRPAID